MLTYIIRRLLLMIPTLLGITALVFFVMALAPGGIGGPALTKEGHLKAEEARRVREYYNRRYGLDKPVVVQYARWLNQISPIGFRVFEEDVPLPKATAVVAPATAPATSPATTPAKPLLHRAGDVDYKRPAIKWPDLGESLERHRPVGDLISESLPLTMLLNLLSIPIVYSIGIFTGLLAARYRGRAFDVTISAAFLSLWSVPTIWAGVMLIGFLANARYVQLFPTSGLHDTFASTMQFLPHWTDVGFQRGWLLDTLWHLVLPVICLSYVGFAFLSKLTRSSVLENLAEDYVRTARAKGLADRVVLYRHVFRNSTLALITVASGILPSLLGGSIVIETIFSIPGMGRLGVEAVQYRDREVVLAVTLIGGLIGLLSELMRDVGYAIADPRVSYE